MRMCQDCGLNFYSIGYLICVHGSSKKEIEINSSCWCPKWCLAIDGEIRL